MIKSGPLGKAVVMNGSGGRDVLEYAERPDAGPGQAVVQVSYSSVNFMDIGVRQDMLWTEPTVYPQLIGVEGAGRVVEVGEGVEAVPVGDRVGSVYALGSYTEGIAIAASKLVRVADAINDRIAGASAREICSCHCNP
jgi:NADPH2:quinone reductase